MTQSDAQTKVVALGCEDASSDDALTFRVELWDRSRGRPKQILGRAATMALAQAIFQAALADFTGERITLSQGQHILQDTH